jgi:hypothetical protein
MYAVPGPRGFAGAVGAMGTGVVAPTTATPAPLLGPGVEGPGVEGPEVE